MGNKESQPFQPGRTPKPTTGLTSSTCPVGCGRPPGSNVIGFCNQCYSLYMSESFEPSLASHSSIKTSSTTSGVSKASKENYETSSGGQRTHEATSCAEGPSSRQAVTLSELARSARHASHKTADHVDASNLNYGSSTAGLYHSPAPGTPGVAYLPPLSYPSTTNSGNQRPSESVPPMLTYPASAATKKPSPISGYPFPTTNSSHMAKSRSPPTGGHPTNSSGKDGTPQVPANPLAPVPKPRAKPRESLASSGSSKASTIGPPVPTYPGTVTTPSNRLVYPSHTSKGVPGNPHPSVRRLDHAKPGITAAGNPVVKPRARSKVPATAPTRSSACVTPAFAYPGSTRSQTPSSTPVYPSRASSNSMVLPSNTHTPLGRLTERSSARTAKPASPTGNDYMAAYGYSGVVERSHDDPISAGKSSMQFAPFSCGCAKDHRLDAHSSPSGNGMMRGAASQLPGQTGQSQQWNPTNRDTTTQDQFSSKFGNPYSISTVSPATLTQNMGDVDRVPEVRGAPLWSSEEDSGGEEDDLVTLAMTLEGQRSVTAASQQQPPGGARPKYPVPKMLDRPLMEKLVDHLPQVDLSYLHDMLSLSEEDLCNHCPRSVKMDTFLAALVCWKRKAMRAGSKEIECVARLADILELYDQTEAVAILRGMSTGQRPHREITPAPVPVVRPPIMSTQEPMAEDTGGTASSKPLERDLGTSVDNPEPQASRLSPERAEPVKGVTIPSTSGKQLKTEEAVGNRPPGKSAGTIPPGESAGTKPPGESAGTKPPGESGPHQQVRGIRETLMCPIHLDLLENAKTLPCQHVICEECLKGWVASHGALTCPSCNVTHALPPGGVAELPNNFVINSLVDELNKFSVVKDDREDRKDPVSEVQVKASVTKVDDADDGSEVGAKGSDKGAALVLLESDDDDETLSIASSSVSDVYRAQQGALGQPEMVPIAANSLVKKMGKNFVAKGERVKLKLQLHDSEGKRVRSWYRDRVEVTVCTPQGEQVSIPRVTWRKKSGDYWVNFSPDRIGIYVFEVKFDEEQVGGSPLKSVVRPGSVMTLELNPPLYAIKAGVTFVDGEIVAVEDGLGCLTLCSSDVVKEWEEMPGDSPSPFGIAAFGGKVFVTNSSGSCVCVFRGLKFNNHFGKRVLMTPTGIAIDRAGVIYVADSATNRIDMFRANYSHYGSIELGGNDRSSLAMLALNQAQDRIIVADVGLNTIKVCDIASTKIVRIIKTRINQTPVSPFGVLVDDDDNIFVSVTADPSKPRGNRGREVDVDLRGKGAVIAYNTNGYFLGTIGENQLSYPRGICWSPDEAPKLVVVDITVNQGSSLKFFKI